MKHEGKFGECLISSGATRSVTSRLQKSEVIARHPPSLVTERGKEEQTKSRLRGFTLRVKGEACREGLEGEARRSEGERPDPLCARAERSGWLERELAEDRLRWHGTGQPIERRTLERPVSDTRRALSDDPRPLTPKVTCT